MKKLGTIIALMIACIMLFSACEISDYYLNSYDYNGYSTAEPIDVEMIDVSNLVLTNAINQLKLLGFSNITYKAINDFIIIRDNWIVLFQNIESGTTVKSTTKIELTCVKIDVWATENFIGLTVNEAEDFASSVKMEINAYYDYLTIHENTQEINSLSEYEKMQWIVKGAEEYSWTGTINLFVMKDETQPIIHDHSLHEVPYSAPSCKSEGNEKYFVCDICKKTFADENATSEITAEDYVIEKLNHTVVIDSAVEATKETTGLTEGSHCSVCGEIIVKQEVVPIIKELPVMPALTGVFLSDVMVAARGYGLERRYADENWGKSGMMCYMNNASLGLELEIIYEKSTMRVIACSIFSSNLSSLNVQKTFIIDMSVIMCPKSDSDKVSAWVKQNVATKCTTTINGLTYELGYNIAGNLTYDVAIAEWTAWSLAIEYGSY